MGGRAVEFDSMQDAVADSSDKLDLKKSHFQDAKKTSKTLSGLILAGVTGGTAVLLSVITAPFLAPALRKVCLPYVPATNQQVTNVLRALEGRTGKCIDLGSGDGRIVISIAKTKNHVQATGIELNPYLVWYSRFRAWNKGVAASTSFMRKDLWKFNLSPFENVIIFGVKEMMPDMQTKFSRELGKNSQIVACRFPLPDWTPCGTVGEGIDTVWIYKLPDSIKPFMKNEA